MTDCRKRWRRRIRRGAGGAAQALLPRDCARFSREGTRHGGTGTRYLQGPNGRTEETDKASATHPYPAMYACACEAGTVSAATATLRGTDGADPAPPLFPKCREGEEAAASDAEATSSQSEEEEEQQQQQARGGGGGAGVEDRSNRSSRQAGRREMQRSMKRSV